MGALETVGAGIAGVGAARLILGSPKAAIGAAAGGIGGAARNALVGTAAAGGAAVAGTAAGGLLGIGAAAAAADGAEGPRDGFQFGMTSREKIGWGAGGVVVAAVGAGMFSTAGKHGALAGAIGGMSLVAATGYVTNFTRAGE